MINKYKILAVEDEKQMQRLFDLTLREHDYNVRICGSKKECLTQLKLFAPDLVLLDLGLPDGDGNTLIGEIRLIYPVPIIVVSARNSYEQIVESLNIGADDYISKPFHTAELIARINSALRRVQKKEGLNIVTAYNIEMNIEKREMKLDNEAMHLTPLEYNLLKCFMQNQGKALTHYFILKEVWGSAHIDDTRTLRTFINQLRKKIEIDPNRPRKIVTISGVGYRFGDW